MAEDKIQKLIEGIEKLSVLELNQLVKSLEEKFDVKAQMMMPAASAGSQSAEKTEEKTIFDVILKTVGTNKISTIKTVREIKPDLGLKEAKDLVEAAPQVLLKEVKKEEAEEAKKKIEAAGAEAELK